MFYAFCFWPFCSFFWCFDIFFVFHFLVVFSTFILIFNAFSFLWSVSAGLPCFCFWYRPCQHIRWRPRQWFDVREKRWPVRAWDSKGHQNVLLLIGEPTHWKTLTTTWNTTFCFDTACTGDDFRDAHSLSASNICSGLAGPRYLLEKNIWEDSKCWLAAYSRLLFHLVSQSPRLVKLLCTLELIGIRWTLRILLIPNLRVPCNRLASGWHGFFKFLCHCRKFLCLLLQTPKQRKPAGFFQSVIKCNTTAGHISKILACN